MEHEPTYYTPLLFIIDEFLIGMMSCYLKGISSSRSTNDLGGSSAISADAEDIINTAAGGTGNQLEYPRKSASGTFTFVSGIVFYYCFTVSYIIYGFLIKVPFQMDALFGNQFNFTSDGHGW